MKAKPFLLKPSGKNYLWGGSRLKDDYGKNLPMTPLAETWECSTHPDGLSYIGNGMAEGFSLREVLEKHPEYLGTHARTLMSEDAVKNGELPVLIKLLDAKENLSVQVHPDDEYAARNENGSMGKIEMWYILDAKEGSGVYYGFFHDMEREKLQKSLEDGSVVRYLQWVSVKKGDVFCIDPGTVHAIGAGTVLAEIQENSNITYRLYDFGRDRELPDNPCVRSGTVRDLHQS